MRTKASLLALIWPLALWAGEGAPPSAQAAMDELWRRGVCMLSNIVEPAQRASQVPRDLGQLPVLDGRLLSRKGSFACFALDGDRLWAATDARLDKIDLAARKRVATLTPADGLPDSPIDGLLADGKSLWVVSRTGLGLVDTAAGRCRTEGLPRFRIARLAASPQALWVVADTGTFVLDRASGAWRQLPPLPTARIVAAKLDEGLWGIRWAIYTNPMIEDAELAGGKLWALSMGTLSRLDGEKWKQLTDDAWAIEPDGDALWALSSKGVERYGAPDDAAKRYTTADGLAAGRHRLIAVTGEAVWVATDPNPKPDGQEGGGLSRFDKAKGTWSHVEAINGLPVTRITCLAAQGDGVWMGSLVFDKFITLSAHPGMMHVKRSVPEVTGLAAHILGPDGRWQSVRCPLPEGEPRYICGQKGTVNKDMLVPSAILELAPTPLRIYAVFEMQPRRFYGGTCHSVGLVARRPSPDAAWVPGIEDMGSKAGFEGEQPEVLLVSESHGKRIIFATGQPRALALGIAAGRAWVLSEHALACETEAPGQWQKVVGNRDRFYWEPTAAVADADAVWIGGDAGTVSRLDRKTMACEAVACLKGRKVTRLAADGKGGVWVWSTAAKVALPSELKDVPLVEAKDLMIYDGQAWREKGPDDGLPPPAPLRYEWRCDGNFLVRRDRASGKDERVAFLRGVFKPSVLCEDEGGKALWVEAYDAILRVALPGEEK